jgi:hypothetical protein
MIFWIYSWLIRNLPGSMSLRLKKIRAMYRNYRVLGKSAMDIQILSASQWTDINHENEIRSVYEEYVNSVSSPIAAISIELALVSWQILNKMQPKIILDLGSGFSSYLFRLYQSKNANSKVSCLVYSCDDSEQWLQRTYDFLKNKNLSTSGLFLWNEFLEKNSNVRPDFILHDIGHPRMRIQTLRVVIDMCHCGTILLLDDIQKENIRQAVLTHVKTKELRCYDLSKLTFDKFGRYAWLARKPELSKTEESVICSDFP